MEQVEKKKLMEKRITRLRKKLEERGLDAMLVTCPVEDIFHTTGANRRYLSGFTGSMGTLLITMTQGFIAVDFRYYEQATKQAPHLTLYQATGPMSSWLPGLFGEAGVGGKQVAYEPNDLTKAQFDEIIKIITNLPEGERPQLVAAPRLIEELRAIKDPEELAAIQRAIDLGDAAFTAVAQRIEPGWTEKQVAWEIEKYAREHGAEGLSFPIIVAAGPHGALPHAQPRDYVIQEGDGLVIDMGVVVDGYCSDLTRTIYIGKPDDKFKEIYDIVLTAQMTAYELVRPGMKGSEAHALAQRVIDEAGYGDKFGHGLGHGIGLQVHEAPGVGRTSENVLEEGMVFTLEPGIYIPGWGGVRIEDNVVLKDGRAHLLSHAPKLDLLAPAV